MVRANYMNACPLWSTKLVFLGIIWNIMYYKLYQILAITYFATFPITYPWFCISLWYISKPHRSQPKHIAWMNFILWLKPKTTAMIFFATIYRTQGKILVKSIIPQEYTVLREETTITLFIAWEATICFCVDIERKSVVNILT